MASELDQRLIRETGVFSRLPGVLQELESHQILSSLKSLVEKVFDECEASHDHGFRDCLKMLFGVVGTFHAVEEVWLQREKDRLTARGSFSSRASSIEQPQKPTALDQGNTTKATSLSSAVSPTLAGTHVRSGSMFLPKTEKPDPFPPYSKLDMCSPDGRTVPELPQRYLAFEKELQMTDRPKKRSGKRQITAPTVTRSSRNSPRRPNPEVTHSHKTVVPRYTFDFS